MQRPVRLIALAALAALACVPASAQAAAVPGVNLATGASPDEFNLAADNGAKIVRMFVHWSDVQPTAPTDGNDGFNSFQVDSWKSVVAASKSRSVGLLLVLVDAPA